MTKGMAALAALLCLSGCSQETRERIGAWGRTAPVLTTEPMKVLKGSYVSGFNRICIYDQLGSDVAVTVNATEMCPQ